MWCSDSVTSLFPVIPRESRPPIYTATSLNAVKSRTVLDLFDHWPEGSSSSDAGQYLLIFLWSANDYLCCEETSNPLLDRPGTFFISVCLDSSQKLPTMMTYMKGLLTRYTIDSNCCDDTWKNLLHYWATEFTWCGHPPVEPETMHTQNTRPGWSSELSGCHPQNRSAVRVSHPLITLVVHGTSLSPGCLSHLTCWDHAWF